MSEDRVAFELVGTSSENEAFEFCGPSSDGELGKCTSGAAFVNEFASALLPEEASPSLPPHLDVLLLGEQDPPLGPALALTFTIYTASMPPNGAGIRPTDVAWVDSMLLDYPLGGWCGTRG